MHNMD